MILKRQSLNNTFYTIVLSVFFGFFTLLAQAETDTASAESEVESVSNRILTILSEKKDEYEANPQALYDIVEVEILPFIDFEGMSKLTLAKHWKTASETQREQFVAAYKQMMVRTYVKSLAKYAGATLKVDGSNSRREGYVSVLCKVIPGDLAVNYDLRLIDGSWKAYNVTIEGLSLIKNYRTSFGREINETSLDALIQRIQNDKSDTETPEA